jgi:hypothetical protein
MAHENQFKYPLLLLHWTILPFKKKQIISMRQLKKVLIELLMKNHLYGTALLSCQNIRCHKPCNKISRMKYANLVWRHKNNPDMIKLI